MRVIVNQIEQQVAEKSSISDVLSLIEAKIPYAVAVNLQFVPKTMHAHHLLNEGDQLEVIAPVTGG
ncbi:sulfur carrier protein ThiS [Polynucleobacter antarcticus]|uniref:Thiamine biosynthesis protein ThiS n=1 Tax=Polynucleobacter antarcticus TaxID=1743162 RepID=A0A6M9PIC7_9BURK|nr:sulfur carrier protein ThiS [Polynucleobacter antarcticus]QKM62630.1 thiamine biosynthesis protein ThiS [Polynucleobacter antarcticus]